MNVCLFNKVCESVSYSVASGYRGTEGEERVLPLRSDLQEFGREL